VRSLSPATQNGYRKQVDAVIYRPQMTERRFKQRLQNPYLLRLDPDTQKNYIQSIVVTDDREREPSPEPFGLSPVTALGKPEINAFIEYQIAVRGLHMARASRAVISAAFSWGTVSTTWRILTNPAIELTIEQPEGRIVIYTDAEIRTYLAVADYLERPSLGDSIMLGLFTGQRQGDRLALEDAGLFDGRRRFRQNKTGVVVAIRETAQLASRLEEARTRVAKIALKFGLEKEKRPITIIVDEHTGRAWSADTYRHVFAEIRAAAAAGILDEEATAKARAEGHPEKIWRIAPCPSLAEKRDQDLRDTAVTWLARAGATLPEIACVTCHSLASIHNILKHYLAVTPELGDAAIAKLTAWMEREGIAI
jgi:hypothetical protein